MRHEWQIFPAQDHRLSDALREAEARGFHVEAVLGAHHSPRTNYPSCVVGRRLAWPHMIQRWVMGAAAAVAVLVLAGSAGSVSLSAQPPFVIYGNVTGTSQTKAVIVDSSGNLQVGLNTGTNSIGTVNQGTANATPWNENVAQFFGSVGSTGVGAAGSGIPRVTESYDDISGSQSLSAGSTCPAFSTTAVTSNTSCIQVPLTGLAGASFEFQAGTFQGTLIFEYTTDATGTLWSTALFTDNSNCQILLKTYTANNTYALFHALGGNNMAGVRVRVLAFTSGAATMWARASKVASVFTVGGLPVGQLGSCQPSFGTQIGGFQITLQASQVSGITATTTTRTTTTTVGACRALDVYINITAAGTATGTLQLFLEDSSDGGTSWNDLISDTAFTFGAAIRLQRYSVQGSVTQQTMTAATLAAAAQGGALTVEAPPVAAPYARQGPFGDRLRVREKVSAPSGSPVGPTYTINAVCK